ncbi:MAG: hypothetical protein IJ825_06510 [Oscillospiraceae bacterium]|nr:hypothetical protein [Oscillospiraceae bacterium]
MQKILVLLPEPLSIIAQHPHGFHSILFRLLHCGNYFLFSQKRPKAPSRQAEREQGEGVASRQQQPPPQMLLRSAQSAWNQLLQHILHTSFPVGYVYYSMDFAPMQCKNAGYTGDFWHFSNLPEKADLY